MDSSTTVPVSNGDGEKGYITGGRPGQSRYHVPILVLRYLTFAATLSAFAVMISNKQSKVIPYLGVQWAKYHYSDAFVWFVIANCFAFVYALLTALFTTFSRSVKLLNSLFLLDLMMSYVILSGAAAATSIAYIGDNGLKETHWIAICDTYHKYCAHVLGALMAGFLGWAFLSTIVVLSAFQRHSDI